MSSIRYTANKPYRPKRKKHSWGKPILVLLALGCIGFGYVKFWPVVQSWFKPTIHEIQSQTQAMAHLQDLLKVCETDNATLLAMVAEADKQTEWMNSPKARQAFLWLLATELDNRGLSQQAAHLFQSILTQQIAEAVRLPETERAGVLNTAIQWANKFAAQGNTAEAQHIYTEVLQHAPQQAVSLQLACLTPLIQYAYNQADIERFETLCKQALNADVIAAVSTTAEAQCLFQILILRNNLALKTNKAIDANDRALANRLLERFDLAATPVHGRLILQELKETLAQENTPNIADLHHAESQLKQALVCFRADVNELPYTPETLLALAKIKTNLGKSEEAELLLAQAEGVALTLGVNTPRILAGNDLNEDIARLRNQLQSNLRAESLIKRAYVDVNLASAFLRAKDFDHADEYLQRAWQIAQHRGMQFEQALPPIILNLQAKVALDKEQWARAESLYHDLIEQWDAMSPEQQDTLKTNLFAIEADNLYKTIHRDWANACLKQNRTTEARRVLAKIGESLPEGQPRSTSRGNRRRQRN